MKRETEKTRWLAQHWSIEAVRAFSNGATPTVATTDDLIERLPDYHLAAEAHAYVVASLEKPSRRVGKYARGNVCGHYASYSQSLSLQYESRSGELAWLLRWDIDGSVIGIRDQPLTQDICKADKNGVMRTNAYTPDFLLMLESEIVVVEVKLESDLHRLAEKFPQQWQCEDGLWHYRPMEEHFRQIGLRHIVCTGAESQQIETNNISTLLQALRLGHPVPQRACDNISQALEETAWLTIAQLLERAKYVTYEDVLVLLAQARLHACLKRQLVTDRRSCLVAVNAAHLDAILDTPRDASWPSDEISCLKAPGHLEMQRAIDRLATLDRGVKTRHWYRLRARVAIAKAEGRAPITALIMPRSGNTQSRMSPKKLETLVEHIRTFFVHPNAPSEKYAYSDYRNWMATHHPKVSIATAKTYRRHIGQQDREEVARIRGGRRQGNAAAARSDVRTRSLTAQRPFERGSIDHTQLKVEVVVTESLSGKYTAKPWLSLLSDDATGKVLAFALAFQAPSKRALALLIRSCVREHGRLPEELHSDRGAELQSLFWKSLLAHLEISPDWNPSGHSRFNSQIEIQNRQIKHQWISTLPGSTVGHKKARSLSKGHRPKDHAVLLLEDVYSELGEFLSDYNRRVHGTEICSPQSLFDNLVKTDVISGRFVANNDEFLWLTAYDTNHETYAIKDDGSIEKDCINFCHPELQRLKPKRARTEVRIDPEDPYKLYCKIDDRWVIALATKYTGFHGKDRHTRWSEALRVGDGRPWRDDAKQDAATHQAARRKTRKRNHQSNEKSPSRPDDCTRSRPVVTNSLAHDVFAELRKSARKERISQEEEPNEE